MSVVPIRLAGDPVLKQKCVDVTDFDVELDALAQDLFDTAQAKPDGRGVLGLAANQIGSNKRVILIGHDVYVNPVIIKAEGNSTIVEGCLSQPGLALPVTRAKSIVVFYHDVSGRERKQKARNLLAHAFQHEIDHLDGVLMSERSVSGKDPWLTALEDLGA